MRRALRWRPASHHPWRPLSRSSLQIALWYVTLMMAEVGRMTAGRDAERQRDGRKVRTPQGRVLGNAQGG